MTTAPPPELERAVLARREGGGRAADTRQTWYQMTDFTLECSVRNRSSGVYSDG